MKDWPYEIPYNFADWMYGRVIVAVRKYVDPEIGIPSTIFMTDDAVIVQNGAGKAVFLGDDHQRYVLDSFNLIKAIGELVWDFESPSNSCVRLSDEVREAVETIRKERDNARTAALAI